MRKLPRQILNVTLGRQEAQQVVAVARFQIENRVAGFFDQARIALARNIATEHAAVGIKIILDVDRVHAALGFEHATVVIKFFEELGIERCRGHNQFEFGAGLQNRLENAKQDVDIQRAFMRFVNHDRRILAKESVVAEFLQQDTVGHHLNGGRAIALLPETNLGAHKRFVFQFFAQAVCNRNRRQAPRFRDTDLERLRV